MNNFNLQTDIRCKCALEMTEEKFAKHFQKCESFKKVFRQFDSDFSVFLKNYSEPKDNLLIIRFLLKQYIQVLSKKIKAQYDIVLYVICSFVEIIGKSNQNSNKKDINNPNTNETGNSSSNTISNSNDNSYINSNGNGNKINNDIEINHGQINIDIDPGSDYARPFTQEHFFTSHFKPKKNKSGEDPNVQNQNQSQSQDQEICQLCPEVNVIYLECCHCICKSCFISLAEKDIPNIECSKCKSEKKPQPQCLISEKDKKAILGTKKYDDLYDQCNIILFGNVVECPNCKEKNSFEKGNTDYNIKDTQNKRLTKEAAEHYASNRCRCPSCQCIFCISCKVIPYHLGRTCKEYNDFLSSKKCRYDNTVITDESRGPTDIVCMNNECTKKFKSSCKKKLECGHQCFGCKKESKCPPCLDRACPMYGNLYDQDIDSYCNICFIEGLGNAPVVLLSCNHYIHYACIEKRLKKKWIGPKITFNHCLCPQCNNWVDCPTVPNIQDIIASNLKLYSQICQMALERLKFEGLNKDSKLTDPNSKWFNNELSYALNRLSYYMCYECKHPYFAGLRECGDGPNVNVDNPNQEYDPKDLICGKHANIFGVAGITECKTHGKEFVEYKCRFCCKISSWFCWGTTHFCDDCHGRQCKGDYVSKYTKEMLPKCDRKKCEIKVPHPPNGDEFALGCRVCRIESSNMKNF